MDRVEGPSIPNVVPPPPSGTATEVAQSMGIPFCFWVDKEEAYCMGNLSLPVLPRIGEAISVDGKHFRVRNIIHVVNGVIQLWAEEY